MLCGFQSMSTLSWTGWPEQFDIRCPKCGGRAVFDEPFSFLSCKEGVPENEPRPVHRWGGWLVVEKYPSVLSWTAPRGSHQSLIFPKAKEGSGYYVVRKKGVVKCSACHHVGVHELNWPEDAFFRWEIRGDTLWAWSAEHARVLLEYIGSEERDATKFPAYLRQLRRLPKQFLSAKVRDLVVKNISDTLAAAN
jgi:hypothetical protein